MKKKSVFRSWACHCGVKYSVSELDPNKHLIPERFKCWAPKCRFYIKRDDSLLPSGITQALALYQAISGLGTGSEKKCGPDDVRKMVLGKKVVAVVVEQAASRDRSLITSLTFEDGKKLHFAASTRGATIYRVTNG